MPHLYEGHSINNVIVTKLTQKDILCCFKKCIHNLFFGNGIPVLINDRAQRTPRNISLSMSLCNLGEEKNKVSGRQVGYIGGKT